MKSTNQTTSAHEELTDEQCNEFRRLNCNFNDMIRAIYNSGRSVEQERCADIVFGHDDDLVIAEMAAKAMRSAKYRTKFPRRGLDKS